MNTLEHDAQVDKTKINIEVKGNGMIKVEKNHRIYCVQCQNNLVPALLEQKFAFIFEEHNITTLINKWNDLNLSRNQLDLTRCILPKMESITPGPNGRLGNIEHVKSTHPYTDPPPQKKELNFC